MSGRRQISRITLPEGIAREFPPERRYLVGVSGGRDSMALLHGLLEQGYLRLIVCHLDHQLRSRASKRDARFVAEAARSAGLHAEIAVTDVRLRARQTNVSIETAGRQSRMEFFAAVARRRRCTTLFLAHHADDLVETALMNFVRGASPAGVAAMRSVSEQRVGSTNLTVVRPLLHFWRSEIAEYTTAHCVRFREDASNALLDATRNRIRHRVLPYIEKQFGRNVRPTIRRTTQIWAEEDVLLESMLAPNGLYSTQLELQWLRALPVALQRRAIMRWLRTQNIPNLSFDVVEQIRALASPDAQVAKVNLPGNRHARRRARKIFLD
ncbi:MAG: tRNA lysidine(34) synthetase TilS [Verrucomicrobia bacterium]|nr:tRNA lysidine(34) synthetase TilS [Verrucomicrobiota bacterium]